MYGSPLKWVVMLAPLAFVFFLSFRLRPDELRDRADDCSGFRGD